VRADRNPKTCLGKPEVVVFSPEKPSLALGFFVFHANGIDPP